jgi:O-antigen/teichoic acid export membrane protein
VGKGVAVAVNFLLVPLTVTYLGPENFGAWSVLLTLLSWMSLADLGIGNTLLNGIVRAKAAEDTRSARELVSSAFCLLSIVAAVVSIVIVGVALTIGWDGIYNAKSLESGWSLTLSTTIALVSFAIGLPLSIGQKILAAYQSTDIANIWQAVASIGSLFGVWLVTLTMGGMPLVVLGYCGMTLLANTAATLWLFVRHKPEISPRLSAVSRSTAVALGRTGAAFFVIQVSALILFFLDNFVIAQVMGAESVGPYAVIYRLFTVTSLVPTLMLPALWPAFTDAVARNDYFWVSHTLKRTIAVCVTIALLLCLLLFISIPIVLPYWAPGVAIPSATLMIWMSTWNVLLALMNPTSTLLNASGRIHGQVIYGVISSGVNLILSFLFVGAFGTAGAVAATVISYTTCSVVPQLIETKRALSHLRRESLSAR